MTDPPVAPGDPPLRALELMRVLREHGVEFVVIGGFSLAIHGFVRGTKDLDVIPAPGSANRARLWSALRALDAKPIAAGDFKPEELPVPFSLEGLAEGGNWLLSTRYGRLDVMQYIEASPDYDRLARAAVRPDALPGVPDPPLFAGYDDLIAMKRAAGRPQDLVDIAELKRAREQG